MEFLQDKWNIFQGSSFFLNKITNCYLKKKKKKEKTLNQKDDVVWKSALTLKLDEIESKKLTTLTHQELLTLL